MKYKKSIYATILAIGCAVTFTGCSGCAGCNSNSANTAPLKSNWYSQTTVKTFQPTFIKGVDNENFSKEIVHYSVKLNRPEASNSYYKVDYSENASYTTEFYAIEFDYATLAHEDYLEEYRNAAYPDGEENAKEPIIAYYYKTTYTVPTITFTFKPETASEKTEEFTNNVIETECYFLSVRNLLRPLYSRSKVNFVSPANLNPSTLEDCYGVVKRTTVNQYNWEGTAVKTTLTIEDGDMADGKSGTYSDSTLSESKNTLFDNSSLNIAVRAMGLGSSISQNISIITEANEKGKSWDDYTVLSGASLSLTDTERTYITGELAKQGLFKYKDPADLAEGEKDEVKSVAVSIGYNGGSFSGAAQSMLFAAIENKDYNIGRATMLKMSVPLTYNVGTVEFVLANIESTIY